MKIFYFAAECKPYSKAGGVGDVAGELPIVLKEMGVDISIITPLHGRDPQKFDAEKINQFNVLFENDYQIVEIYRTYLKDVPVFFIKNDKYFYSANPYVNSVGIPFFDDIKRYSFFCEAALQLIKEYKPEIVHINDWPLCYLFGLLELQKLKLKKVLTIHNIGYQGNIGKETIIKWHIEKILKAETTRDNFTDPREEWKSVNALKLGIEMADFVNTVSPNYANEICQPEDENKFFEGAKGLHLSTNKKLEKGKLSGILNGFDYKFKPTHFKFGATVKQKSETKKIISRSFNKPDNFLIGFVGRAVEQKFKLLTETVSYNNVNKSVLAHLIDMKDINYAFLGTGLPEYEQFMASFESYDNCSFFVGFDRERAQNINLGCDMFLMPSLFEPCGITQLEAMSSATPPLVRITGGLADTVNIASNENQTGFGFNGESRNEVLINLIKTVEIAKNVYYHSSEKFKQIQKNGFYKRFKWDAAAKEYIKIYKSFEQYKP